MAFFIGIGWGNNPPAEEVLPIRKVLGLSVSMELLSIRKDTKKYLT